ncbi:MAG: hypothetical protein CMJ27_08000 [Phycisphaerae bacterium]|nr:hypothetical protein [Phycisphaerae bacterium]OUX93421.1 MAG: hypothetical protein CBB77_09110 [Hyphomonas sp. TMED17]
MPLQTTLLAIALAASNTPSIPAPPPDADWWPTDLPARVVTPLEETPAEHDARMAWWREARFGMFIHWGLYAIPGGYWEGRRTGGAEWILNTVKIHPDDYMALQSQFDPVDFDATEWAIIAKNAGMRYLVLTSKHHDGFCLWPSDFTTFDVEGTPFERDILGELVEACRAEGVVPCLYHSIMDWTHPDYLPRRAWDDRPGGDHDRYVEHLHRQLEELIERYGPGVLWFDGEWEGSWTHADGQRTYDLIRRIDPRIIVNNRVDTGRTGMAGLTRAGGYRGDFGTPEQEIPANGLPEGVDWETCMTMNRSWGYQSFDLAYKTTSDLVRKLVDIASKGGNFLLNVGPDERGRFPLQAKERLAGVGRWMSVNDDSIHGTRASPFPTLDWGRCTRSSLPDGGERLYLHVFDRPEDGVLRLPGLLTRPMHDAANLLAAPAAGRLRVERDGADLTIELPADAMVDPIDTVVILDLVAPALVVEGPRIAMASGIFIDPFTITIESPDPTVQIRSTTDGSDPTFELGVDAARIEIDRTTTLRTRCFHEGEPVGAVVERRFERVKPIGSVQPFVIRDGLAWRTFLGEFERVSDFAGAATEAEGVVATVDLSMQPRDENFAVTFTGFIEIPATGVWAFALDSDDGSTLRIHESVVVDNDGLHSALEKSGTIALEAGLHPIRIDYFEGTGQDDLILKWSSPGSDTFMRIPTERFKR